MNWARPGGTVARVGFKLTASHASPIRTRQRALRRVPVRPMSHRLTVADVRDRDRPLSLSSSRIKMATPTEASFFRRFLPNAEMRHPVAHHRLAAIWLRHWAIPRVWLIYTSLRFFCPGFWHHRRTPPSATADHVGDLCPSPVRACSTASRRWQAVAGKLPSSAPNPRGVLVQLWS
jgi:hypothetical protein